MPARDSHNPVWGLSFFQPHSWGRGDRLKKESMNISLSGIQGQVIANRNSGWLERTCKMLAASQEAVLQAGLEICCKPHLHPHIHSTEFISIHGGGVARRMREGNSEGASGVHCLQGTCKKGSWKKCKATVTLSVTMSSLLQKHATAKCSTARAEPKLSAPQERTLMSQQTSLC